MRFTIVPLALALVACGGDPPATDPAPANPGVHGADSTTYQGSPFVPGADDLVFVESATGTRFNLVGQAFEGPLADDRVQLGVLPGMTAFWFAWSVHHPGARVWNNGVNNEGVQILSNDECGVPCEEMRQGCFGGRDCIPSIDNPDWTTAS
ncbi:MAG: hypothetical protein JRI25_17285, partial [Deltaproteobacteria bacterium]|nr:hypothetical protein [Deltaproteobacteria bacterium]